jgi:hypothetical protein
MAVGAVQVLSALASAAAFIAENYIFKDGKLNEELDQILKRLDELRNTIVEAVAQILEAIDGIRRQIDEDVALENMALADRALLSDLAISHNMDEAMGNSFQAASRLEDEDDVSFAAPFIYVINMRLAVLKEFDPNYSGVEQFRQEFQGYVEKLSRWIEILNDAITNSHTVSLMKRKEAVRPEPDSKPTVIQYWLGIHLHNKVTIKSFKGPVNNITDIARRKVEQQAKQSRDDGIKKDRHDLGVVEMEKTRAIWIATFRL